MEKTLENYLLRLGFSSSTVKSHYRDIIDFIDWCEAQNMVIEEASYNELLGYVQYLGNKGFDRRSIAHKLTSIKHYYNWLVKNGRSTDNPVKQIQIKGIKKRVLYKVLSHQELEHLYSNYPSTTATSKRNRVIVGLLIYQGLHSGSLARLQVKDVDLRQAKIYITSDRTSNERTLQLEAHQILDMMEYIMQIRPQLLSEAKKQSEQLIISSGSSDQISNTIAKVTKQLKRLNPTITTLKQIRTSVITHWLKKYNLREVQYRAGHRYISSTEAYQVNDMDGMKAAINIYHPDID